MIDTISEYLSPYIIYFYIYLIELISSRNRSIGIMDYPPFLKNHTKQHIRASIPRFLNLKLTIPPENPTVKRFCRQMCTGDSVSGCTSPVKPDL